MALSQMIEMQCDSDVRRVDCAHVHTYVDDCRCPFSLKSPLHIKAVNPTTPNNSCLPFNCTYRQADTPAQDETTIITATLPLKYICWL